MRAWSGRRAARRAGEPGQDPVVLEPAKIVWMAGEHGLPRRRAEYAGGADDRAEQAVHERRLARAGRASDHHQHGRLHLLEAREQVVVDLGDEIVADATGLRCAGHVELEPDASQVVAQSAKRLGDVCCHVGRLPAARER